MDPATVAGLSALFGLVREFGPLGAVGIIAFFLVRAWRTGEFLSRAMHTDIVSVLKDRLEDWKARYDASQSATTAWRTEAERAAQAAAVAQAQHQGILAELTALETQVRELRDDVRDQMSADRRVPPVRGDSSGGH